MSCLKDSFGRAKFKNTKPLQMIKYIYVLNAIFLFLPFLVFIVIVLKNLNLYINNQNIFFNV